MADSLRLLDGHRGTGRRLEGTEQHRRRHQPVHVHGRLAHGPQEELGEAGQDERRRLFGLECHEDAGDRFPDEPVREADEREAVHLAGGLDVRPDPQRPSVHLDAVHRGNVPPASRELRVREEVSRGGEHAVRLALEGVHDPADDHHVAGLALVVRVVHLQHELAAVVLQRNGLRDVLVVGHMRIPSPVLTNPTECRVICANGSRR